MYGYAPSSVSSNSNMSDSDRIAEILGDEILDQIAKSLADYLQIAKVIVPDPGHEEEFEKAGKHIEKAIKRIKNRTKLDKYFNLDYLEEHPEIINDLR